MKNRRETLTGRLVKSSNEPIRTCTPSGDRPLFAGYRHLCHPSRMFITSTTTRSARQTNWILDQKAQQWKEETGDNVQGVPLHGMGRPTTSVIPRREFVHRDNPPWNRKAANRNVKCLRKFAHAAYAFRNSSLISCIAQVSKTRHRMPSGVCGVLDWQDKIVWQSTSTKRQRGDISTYTRLQNLTGQKTRELQYFTKMPTPFWPDLFGNGRQCRGAKLWLSITVRVYYGLNIRQQMSHQSSSCLTTRNKFLEWCRPGTCKSFTSTLGTRTVRTSDLMYSAYAISISEPDTPANDECTTIRKESFTVLAWRKT